MVETLANASHMLVDGLLHDLELYKPRVLVKAELRDSSNTKRFIIHCNSQGEAIKSEILDLSEQTMLSHEAGRFMILWIL